MFSLDAVSVSHHSRSSSNLWLGEVVATFGLLVVIFGVVRGGRAAMTPFAVGAYISGAYLFTSSTSFANPAVTVARTMSNTFAGIDPSSMPAFLGAQVVGLAIAIAVIRVLWPGIAELAEDGVIPHGVDDAVPRDALRG
jgi:arsenate reductase